MHISHKGCRASCAARTLRHAAVWYRSLCAGLRKNRLYSRSAAFRCISQNCPSVRFGHPGCLHGFKGFRGILLTSIPFPGNRKALTGFTLQRLHLSCYFRAFMERSLFHSSSIIIPYRNPAFKHFMRNIAKHSGTSALHFSVMPGFSLSAALPARIPGSAGG